MKALPIESILDTQEWLALNILATYDSATDQDKAEGETRDPASRIASYGMAYVAPITPL